MSQLPFSGMSGFSSPVQSPDIYETKSIFAFSVKLKGSFLHRKLTNIACWRKSGTCDGKFNSCFQLHPVISESNNLKEKCKFESNPRSV